jgi:hypothetical protein
MQDKKTFYEVEEFDDGTFQIASGKEAKQNYEDEIKQGCKRKKFVEIHTPLDIGEINKTGGKKMVRTQKLKSGLYTATINVKNGKQVPFGTQGSQLKVVTGSSPSAVKKNIKSKYN